MQRDLHWLPTRRSSDLEQDPCPSLLDSRQPRAFRGDEGGDPGLNHELFMAEAIAEARPGREEGEIPVGAVAVLDDAVTARSEEQTSELPAQSIPLRRLL